MPRPLPHRPLRAASLAGLAALLTACGPPPEEFTEAFRETYCEVRAEDCDAPLTLDACRARGFPDDVLPPEPAGCTYRRWKAGACLDASAWACQDAGGEVIVVPPDACAEVWDCSDGG